MILPLTVVSLAQAESVGQHLGTKTLTRKIKKLKLGQVTLTACLANCFHLFINFFLLRWMKGTFRDVENPNNEH